MPSSRPVSSAGRPRSATVTTNLANLAQLPPMVRIITDEEADEGLARKQSKGKHRAVFVDTVVEGMGGAGGWQVPNGSLTLCLANVVLTEASAFRDCRISSKPRTTARSSVAEREPVHGSQPVTRSGTSPAVETGWRQPPRGHPSAQRARHHRAYVCQAHAGPQWQLCPSLD